MTPWCRICKCPVHVAADGTVHRDGDPIRRPQKRVVYVCTVCYHQARLLHGIDLSKPPEE